MSKGTAKGTGAGSVKRAGEEASAGPAKKKAAKKGVTKKPTTKKPASKKPASKKPATKKGPTKKSAGDMARGPAPAGSSGSGGAGSVVGGSGGAGSTPAGPLTAATADRHALYQASVQNVEAEIDFIDAEFKRLRGRRAVVLREDFCGTGFTSCEWARRRAGNVAIGLDIHRPTLAWGERHNVGALEPGARERVRLLSADVMGPPGEAVGVDAVLAMNFSYWLFRTRDELRAYFARARESLGPEGVFFCDHYGGSEAASETQERRRCRLPDGRAFTYVWDQHRFNPISGEMECRIHFEFPDGTKRANAFTYVWRQWTLPEVREILVEAGFGRVTVYWEGDDGKGGGDGVFKPATRGTADPAFICYISAMA